MLICACCPSLLIWILKQVIFQDTPVAELYDFRKRLKYPMSCVCNDIISNGNLAYAKHVKFPEYLESFEE